MFCPESFVLKIKQDTMCLSTAQVGQHIEKSTYSTLDQTQLGSRSCSIYKICDFRQIT